MSESVQTSAVGAFPVAIQAWTPSCSTAKKAFVVFSLIVAGVVVAAVIWRWRTQESTPTQASADRVLRSLNRADARGIYDNFKRLLDEQMDGCTIGRLDGPKSETELRECYIQMSQKRHKNFVFFPEVEEGSSCANAGTFYFKTENSDVVLKAFIVGKKGIEFKFWGEDNTFLPVPQTSFAALKKEALNMPS